MTVPFLSSRVAQDAACKPDHRERCRAEQAFYDRHSGFAPRVWYRLVSAFDVGALRSRMWEAASVRLTSPSPRVRQP